MSRAFFVWTALLGFCLVALRIQKRYEIVRRGIYRVLKLAFFDLFCNIHVLLDN